VWKLRSRRSRRGSPACGRGLPPERHRLPSGRGLDVTPQGSPADGHLRDPMAVVTVTGGSDPASEPPPGSVHLVDQERSCGPTSCCTSRAARSRGRGIDSSSRLLSISSDLGVPEALIRCPRTRSAGGCRHGCGDRSPRYVHLRSGSRSDSPSDGPGPDEGVGPIASRVETVRATSPPRDPSASGSGREETIMSMSPLHAPQVGQSAPELVLPTLDGGTVDLQALRGHAVLISFLRHAG
jgi:hypothetical protein